VRYRSVDLNLLVIVDALLTEGNVTRAALRLNLTQPAVSNALARLREHYQDELFVAVGRRMVPTELAERLAIPVRHILEQSQAVIQERSGFDPATARRRFYVAVSDYEGTVFMPEVSRHVAAIAPQVAISLRLTFSHAQLTFPQVAEILEQRHNDFVVLPDMLASADHPRERLYEETYLCIGWSGNESLGDSLSLEQYLDAEHVVAEFADNRAPSFEGDALARAGHVRKVAVAVEQFTLIPEYIVGTRRLATVHAGLARKFAERFPIKLYPVPVVLPPLTIVVQWNRVRERDPGVQWILATLSEVARRFRT
jgi:LysR family nod box-dependent transcriptional activator